MKTSYRTYRVYYVPTCEPEAKEAEQIEYLVKKYHFSRNDLLKRLIRIGLKAVLKNNSTLLSGNIHDL